MSRTGFENSRWNLASVTWKNCAALGWYIALSKFTLKMGLPVRSLTRLWKAWNIHCKSCGRRIVCHWIFWYISLAACCLHSGQGRDSQTSRINWNNAVRNAWFCSNCSGSTNSANSWKKVQVTLPHNGTGGVAASGGGGGGGGNREGIFFVLNRFLLERRFFAICKQVESKNCKKNNP